MAHNSPSQSMSQLAIVASPAFQAPSIPPMSPTETSSPPRVSPSKRARSSSAPLEQQDPGALILASSPVGYPPESSQDGVVYNSDNPIPNAQRSPPPLTYPDLGTKVRATPVLTPIGERLRVVKTLEYLLAHFRPILYGSQALELVRDLEGEVWEAAQELADRELFRRPLAYPRDGLGVDRTREVIQAILALDVYRDTEISDEFSQLFHDGTAAAEPGADQSSGVSL